MLATRNLQNVNFAMIIIGFLLCLVFTLQVKQIYDKNQKFNRYLGYKQYITEISSEMIAAERTANESFAYVRLLNDAILRHERESRGEISRKIISDAPDRR